ncbi:MAG TPA: SRPBCC family protein [Candidatus Limnocylindrales bacterium]|nr:SRPBCC family protein [Candidatus Limnocylindrales bacterium]
MIRVRASVWIERPIEAVFAYAADYRNDPEWRSEVRDMRYVSDDPVGVGTREIETVVVWGRRVVTETEITAYEPNRLVSFGYVSGPIRVRGSRTFETVEGGTRFTFALESQATGLLDRLISPITGFLYQRQLDGSVGRMRTILESKSHGAVESVG